MASAWGWFVRSAEASISSVVVRPLPHSRTINRNGALVMPAMGAMRASALVSTEPIFMGRSIPSAPSEPVSPRHRGRERTFRSEGPLVDRAGLHDQLEVVRILKEREIAERIALHRDEVGEFPGLDAADVLL